MAFIPCTVDGRETYLREEGILAFGLVSIQVGTDPEDGSAILGDRTVVSYEGGFQMPIDQTPQEFIEAAAGAEE